LKQCLGKGSFAEVFMGKSLVTNEEVAVKVIDKKLFSSRYNIKSIQN
jgi:serine/threonine protein kinase